ncbi:MAG TPA: hypothetical protein VKR82_04690 [Candidatus Acidoferrales bacterium]|nr:hypothetical protein [Candidatus Acidoferrales bacterium]
MQPAPIARGVDFSETVVPITQLKVALGIRADFGTGFCLDAACRFIGTNYHVAMVERPKKIKGQDVVQRYLATGPEDVGATENAAISASFGRMRYTLSRDLAIFELRHPLRHHHGIGFNLADLQIGQEVDIYAYPMNVLNPMRSLVRLPGVYKAETTTGLLAFAYSSSTGKGIRPGASGGIVVDRKTEQIVGILTAIMTNADTVALAVPVQSLVDFVSEVRPYLAREIFPSVVRVSPVSPDIYPKFVPPPTERLGPRLKEPLEVQSLRARAQDLADGMRNFIAVQTFAWGSEVSEPDAEAAYEVRVLDGHQRYRDFPNGKQELADVPFPPLAPSLKPASEWSDLPEMIGTKLGLKIRQAPDVAVGGRRVKVFQYLADAEDRVCKFETIVDYLFFEARSENFVACYGEVWTDQDTNILRVSLHYELHLKWKDYQAAVTYGWMERADGPPHIVPLTFSTQADFKRKTYWCRGQFKNYQVFGSEVRIVRK